MIHATSGPSWLLFDRISSILCEHGGMRVCDTGDLIQYELFRLFNARNGLTIDQFLGDTPTMLHYGLPDTLHLLPQSATDLQRLELVLTRAIVLYEPRLIQARVQATPDPDKPTSARVTISALAALNRQLCQVHFDLVLDGRGARTRERTSAAETQP